MKLILETGRLWLSELTLDDTRFIIELLNSPGWIRFIGDRNVKTEEQAVSYLENGPLKSYLENGYGLYLVEKKEDQQAIGMCGLLKRETLEHPDIGFALLPDFQEKGYGFEIAQATLRYATDTLRIPKVCAITLPDNIKSIRLLEKIGLRFIQPFCSPGSEDELHLYGN
jgi:RimJ/RimL family protein N-acetyltransferase